MSFIVQIFDRVTATDVRTALAACNSDKPVTPRVAAMFDQFLEEVQRYYPLAAHAPAGSAPHLVRGAATRPRDQFTAQPRRRGQ